MSSRHAPDHIAYRANVNYLRSSASPITFPSSDENGVRFSDSYIELDDSVSSFAGRQNFTASHAALPSSGFK